MIKMKTVRHHPHITIAEGITQVCHEAHVRGHAVIAVFPTEFQGSPYKSKLNEAVVLIEDTSAPREVREED